MASSTTTFSAREIKNALLAFTMSDEKEGGLEALRTFLKPAECFTPADAKEYGTTPLIEIVKQLCNQDEVEPGDSRLQMVQMIAASSVSMINAVNSEGITALGIAIQNPDQTLLSTMLENGADPLISFKLTPDSAETTTPFEFVMRLCLGINNFDKLIPLTKHLTTQLQDTSGESKNTPDPRMISILKKLTPGQRTKVQKFANTNEIAWLKAALSPVESAPAPAKVTIATPVPSNEDKKVEAPVVPVRAEGQVEVKATVPVVPVRPEGQAEVKATVPVAPNWGLLRQSHLFDDVTGNYLSTPEGMAKKVAEGKKYVLRPSSVPGTVSATLIGITNPTDKKTFNLKIVFSSDGRFRLDDCDEKEVDFPFVSSISELEKQLELSREQFIRLFKLTPASAASSSIPQEVKKEPIVSASVATPAPASSSSSSSSVGSTPAPAKVTIATPAPAAIEEKKVEAPVVPVKANVPVAPNWELLRQSPLFEDVAYAVLASPEGMAKRVAEGKKYVLRPSSVPGTVSVTYIGIANPKTGNLFNSKIAFSPTNGDFGLEDYADDNDNPFVDSIDKFKKQLDSVYEKLIKVHNLTPASAPVSTSVSSSSSSSVESKDTPKIRCYLDFDGTLTDRNGGATISDPLYQRLVIQKGATYEYSSDPFIERKAMTSLLQEGFKVPTNQNMMISEGAKSCLAALLARNAEIVIISKNRKEYIQAQLELSGFGAYLDRIVIKDIKDIKALPINSGYKGNLILAHEKAVGKPADLVVTADDDAIDFNDMYGALQTAGYSKDKILAYHAPVGGFNWTAKTTEILGKRPTPSSVSSSSPAATSSSSVSSTSSTGTASPSSAAPVAPVKKAEAKVDAPIECKDSKRLQRELASLQSAVNRGNLSEMSIALDVLERERPHFRAPSPLDYLSPTTGQTALGLAIIAANKAAKTYSRDSELSDALRMIKKLLDLGASISTRFRPAPSENYILPLMFMINKQTTEGYHKSTREKELQVIHLLIKNLTQMTTCTEDERIDLCLFAMGSFSEKAYKDKYWERSELDHRVYHEHRRLMSKLINSAVSAVVPADGVPFESLAQDRGFEPLSLALAVINPQLVKLILTTSSLTLEQQSGNGELDTPLMTIIKHYADARRSGDYTSAEQWLDVIDTCLTRWKGMVNQPGASFIGLDYRTFAGSTPLGVAMANNLPEIVSKLLENGASPDFRYTDTTYGHNYTTPLQHAVLFAIGKGWGTTIPSIDPSALVTSLLRHGAKGISESKESKAGEYTSPNETPLGIVIKELSKEEKDGVKKTNLMNLSQAFLTQPDVVKSWLTIPQREHERETPLGNLLVKGHIELAKKLILAGAPLGQEFSPDPSSYNAQYPIQYACSLGNIDLINFMLARPYDQLSNKDGHFDLYHRRNIFLYGGVRSSNENVFRTLMDSPKFECVMNCPQLCDEMLGELVGSKSLSRINYLLARSIPLSQESFIKIITCLKEMMSQSSNQSQFDRVYECLNHLMLHPQMRNVSESKLNTSDSKLVELFDKQSMNPIEHVLKPFVEGLNAIYRISKHLGKPVTLSEGSRKVSFGNLASVSTALLFINPRATAGTGISSNSSSSSSGLFSSTSYDVASDHRAAKAGLVAAIEQVQRSRASVTCS